MIPTLRASFTKICLKESTAKPSIVTNLLLLVDMPDEVYTMLIIYFNTVFNKHTIISTCPCRFHVGYVNRGFLRKPSSRKGHKMKGYSIQIVSSPIIMDSYVRKYTKFGTQAK